MHRDFVRNVLGLVAGFILGLVLTAPLYAQTPVQDGTPAHPYLITPSGGWNKSLKCAAQPVWSIAVDGAPAVPANGVTYTANGGQDAATYPFVALFPQSQMPAAVRTIGPHTLSFIQPATTITLADGVTQYTYPAGTYSESVTTLADLPTTTPPKDNGWRKIIGTIVAFFKMLFHIPASA
jgi:hypothetical protein